MLLALRSHFFEFVAEEVGYDVADSREIPVIPLRADGEADSRYLFSDAKHTELTKSSLLEGKENYQYSHFQENGLR